MNDHDETLREALEENARLRSQHAESLREASSAQFSGRYRWAERIYWLYAIVCVVIGVSVINCFIRTDDTKSLIAYAVLLLVVYETTVLMKLWFAIAGMKMSVLKDVKLLRLEMVRLASAVGVKDPAEPLMEYEPMSRRFAIRASALADNLYHRCRRRLHMVIRRVRLSGRTAFGRFCHHPRSRWSRHKRD